jgi:hypothetical protein
MVPAKGSLTAALPGLHLKSDGSGFRAVYQSRELRSERRFTGSFGTHPRPAKIESPDARKFCSTDKIAVARSDEP